MGIATLSLFLATAAITLAEGFHDNLEEFDRNPAHPIIDDQTADSNRCKTKKACSRKGGRCVTDGICQTFEIEAKCGKEDGNPCKCCARDLKNRCKSCSGCQEDGGFCVMNKKACAQGILREDQCHCKARWGWKKGHCCIPPVTSSSWGYKNDSYGPGNWSNWYPKCAGNNQSPIDINEVFPLIELNLSDDPWVFTGYDAPATPNTITVKNNGHYVTVDWNEATPASIKGGYLGAEYILHELQLRWGRNTTEHLIHDSSYELHELELHFVHYKAEYGDINTAMGHSDGLAIMAAVYSEDTTGEFIGNSEFLPITDAFSSIVEPNSEKTTTFPYSLISLLGIGNELLYWESFIRYSGSLTTPPCSEVVTWTLFTIPGTIPFNQYNAFRSLKFEDGTAMIYNTRPIQPLNYREVNLVVSHPS